MEVDFRNASEANLLLKNSSLKDNGLKVYISSFKFMRKGLIKGVDNDISEKEIIEFIESEYEVLSIRRLSRRNKDL